MSTKTQTTKSGRCIVEVTFIREVQYADSESRIGRQIEKWQSIRLIDANKRNELAHGSNFSKPPKGNYPAGAMRLGDAVVPVEVVEIANSLLAALDDENPKSAEYLKIERRIAAQTARNEADRAAIEAEEDLMRRMDDPNSDL